MSSEGVKNKSPDKSKRKRDFPDGDLSGIRVTKKLFPTQVSVGSSSDELNIVALSTVSAMQATRFITESSPLSPPKRAHLGAQVDSRAASDTKRLLPSQNLAGASSDELNEALSTELTTEAIGFLLESSPLSPPKRAHLDTLADSQAGLNTEKLLQSQILATKSGGELNKGLLTESTMEATRFFSKTSPLSPPKRVHQGATANSQASSETKMLLRSQILAAGNSDELNEALSMTSATQAIGFLSESSPSLLSKREHFSALGDSRASLGTKKLLPSQILAAASSDELNEAVSVVLAMESSTLSLPNLPEGACFGGQADSRASSYSIGSALVDCVVCSEPPSGLKISTAGHTDMHCKWEPAEEEYYHQGERSDCEASEVTACQDETDEMKLVDLLRFEGRAGSEECTAASSSLSKHKRDSHQWLQKWGKTEKLKWANESIRDVQESEVVGILRVEGRRNLDKVMMEFDSRNCEISDESAGLEEEKEEEKEEEEEEERGMVGSLNAPGNFSFTVDTLDETNGEAQKTKPSYVLSSGRLSLEEESSLGTRPPNIDRDFEEYFSSLML